MLNGAALPSLSEEPEDSATGWTPIRISTGVEAAVHGPIGLSRSAPVVERVAALEDDPVDRAGAPSTLPTSVVDPPPFSAVRVLTRSAVVEPVSDWERRAPRACGYTRPRRSPAVRASAPAPARESTRRRSGGWRAHIPPSLRRRSRCHDLNSPPRLATSVAWFVLGRQRAFERLGRLQGGQGRAVVTPAGVTFGEQQRQLQRIVVLGFGQRRPRHGHPVGQQSRGP